MARNEPQFLEFFLHLTPLRLSLSVSYLSSPLPSRLSNHHGGLRITNELRQEVKGRSGQYDSQA
jgi:hypothetical protein